MKRQNNRILKEVLPRSVGTQYATEDQWRNNSRKNERMKPKQKQYPAVDVTGDRSKVRCCKEEYCIGTWNVRSMNQGKMEVVKQEMARVNIEILGISELKWTGMDEFNSDDHRCTCVPNPEPPSHLPPQTIPLGHPSAPAPSILYHALDLDWRFVSASFLSQDCFQIKTTIVSPHTNQNGHHEKIYKQEMLEMIWRKGNPPILLVGM